MAETDLSSGSSQPDHFTCLSDKLLDIDKIRLDIRGSLILDMTDDNEFEMLVERLAGAIRNLPE